jgi:hypothetical protein
MLAERRRRGPTDPSGYELSATKRQAERERNKRLSSARKFFGNNLGRMVYSIHYRVGLPVGSGPVEGACKYIVKSKM